MNRYRSVCTKTVQYVGIQFDLKIACDVKDAAARLLLLDLSAASLVIQPLAHAQ